MEDRTVRVDFFYDDRESFRFAEATFCCDDCGFVDREVIVCRSYEAAMDHAGTYAPEVAEVLCTKLVYLACIPADMEPDADEVMVFTDGRVVDVD